MRYALYFLSSFALLLVSCEFILPNKPPYVELSSPAEQRVYNLGQVIPILLNAYDKDGSVVEIQFYVDDNLVYTDDTEPYEFSWNTVNYTVGDHELKIKAIDNDNEHYILKWTFTILGSITADAGADVTLRTSTVTHQLNANTPEVGATGSWSVVQGAGGSFSSVTLPNAVFTGQACTSYTLRWTVSQGTLSLSDDVNVVFYHTPTDANAGEDQYYDDGRVETTLSANTALEGLGRWNILSGGTGKFDNNLDPNTKFTGLACTDYVLTWTISTACVASVDEVSIHFDHILVAANAGPDQDFIDGTVSTTLDANEAGNNVGTWSVVTGDGGSFSNVNDPKAVFTGQVCETYDLRWSIASGCGVSTDDLVIKFGHIPTTAMAGDDQVYIDGRVTTFLEANEPSQGDGAWTVVSGTGGTFDDATDPKSKFTGTLCETYVLKWTIATACSAIEDEVSVSFKHTPTTANAGQDQKITTGIVVTSLAANTPVQGGGRWTILTGDNGNFLDPNDPNTTFTGQLCGTYVLQWEISTACGSSADQVVITFDHVQIPAYAGIDQSFFDGTVVTVMTGNDPQSATGTWTILSGTSGSFSDVNDPNATFTGALGEVYSLQWAITSTCGISTDIVRIAFLSSGSITDVRDGTIYPTVSIGSQVWLAQNLNYKMVNGSYAYGGEESLRPIYGLLYNFEAANQACPAGYHLPTDAEWRTLENKLGLSLDAALLTGYRGFEEGGALKEAGQSHWHSPNLGATNLTGFTALPTGYRNQNGGFALLGSLGGYWSDTEDAAGDNALYRALSKDKAKIGRDWFSKKGGLAVRCVKD